MPVQRKGIAHFRHLLQHLAGPAADSIRVVFVVFLAELLQQFLQLHVAVHDQGAVFLFDDLLADLVMLVVDLAHQFFQHVLHGDDAVGAAVFIQQDDQVGLARPEQLQQVADGQAGRREHRLLHDLRDVGDALVGHLVEILLMQDTDDMVQVLVIDRNPGEPGVAERVRGLFNRRVVLQGGHVHPGRHDVRRVLVVELDGGTDQFALFLLDVALGLGFIDHGHQFIFNLALFLLRLDHLRQQLPPQGEQPVQGAQHGNQDADHAADGHGVFLRLLLSQRLGADLAQEQHQHRHHHGRNSGGQVLLAG